MPEKRESKFLKYSATSKCAGISFYSVVHSFFRHCVSQYHSKTAQKSTKLSRWKSFDEKATVKLPLHLRKHFSNCQISQKKTLQNLTTVHSVPAYLNKQGAKNSKISPHDRNPSKQQSSV